MGGSTDATLKTPVRIARGVSGDDEANAGEPAEDGEEEPSGDGEEEASPTDRLGSVMPDADDAAPGDGPFDDAFSLDPAAEDGSASDPASPFDELATDVGGSGSADVDFDGLFEEMSTEADGIDADSVWEELEGGIDEEEASGEEHVVPTRAFCAQCDHVADPPDVRCTYEGSEIVEFIDKDNVRVRNCPIVAQRREVSEME